MQNIHPLAVMKFGGGVLKDQQSLLHVASLIAQRNVRRNVIVVSALSGVTDTLVRIWQDHAKGHPTQNGLESLLEQHNAVVKGMSFEKEIRIFFLEQFARMKALLENPLSKEEFISYGERLSCRILCEFIQSLGTGSIHLNSEEAGIRTNAQPENASCDLKKTRENLQALPENACIVLTGFYGIDQKNKVRLFGRGGSDYTAGCVAACLDADLLEIWKDVPGFMTCDPKKFPYAKLVEEVTFAEARELGYFGSKIIHPRTFEPLSGAKTKVVLQDVFHPNRVGTRMTEFRSLNRGPASLSEKNGVVLFSLFGGGMPESAGVVGSIFSALKEASVPVDLISTGVSEVTFSVSEGQKENAQNALMHLLQTDPSLFQEIRLQQGLCNVALVGEGCASANVLAQAFRVFQKEKIEPLAVSCPQSRISLSFIVDQKQSLCLIQALHGAFFEGAKTKTAALSLSG